MKGHFRQFKERKRQKKKEKEIKAKDLLPKEFMYLGHIHGI